ncbi:virion structural protein [Acinetobacter phage AP22]|uniref:Uncharacterized protein n=1 Tax=Acinetobacter phage AP22 TaxID=1187128 RepID=I2GUE8_9CAUD|nr:virion structural protein [Acinetobacter phage AP22]CCH57749.1 hypothetical protein [Acinetobacter phage AP22]
MPMGYNPNTITAANSIVQFRCAGLYDDWITIEGAQSDAFVTFSDVTLAQTRVGVDGKQSMGFIPHETPITVSLEANSRSVPFWKLSIMTLFKTWKFAVVSSKLATLLLSANKHLQAQW